MIDTQKRVEYNRNYRIKHPMKCRKANRKASSKIRKTSKWKEYFRNYMKQWKENPINYVCQTTRNKVSSIKVTLNRNGNNPNLFNDVTRKIYDNLISIGWSTNISKEFCINHKISLKLLFTFKLDLPMDIAFDVRNIEIISRIENSKCAYRRVDSDMIATAKAMEKKYPNHLTGLTEFISKYKKEII